jgi:hypothetical protein
MSKYRTAIDNNSQYFTPSHSSEWCLKKLKEHYGDYLNQMTLLEPCVGRGSFVHSAQNLGIKSPWVTMDLYPSPEFSPDYVSDFRKKVPGFNASDIDLVVTNPPFGDGCSTAKAMVKHAVRTFGKAAMLLPSGCRRPSFFDSMPLDSRLVFDYDVPCEDFDLPDGSVRRVKTVFQLWETESGYVRPLLLESSPISEHYSVDYGKEWSSSHDLGMCCWGSVGRTFVPGEKTYSKMCFWTFHTDLARDAFQSIDWGSYGKEWVNSTVTLSPKDLYTLMNKAVRKKVSQGR